MLEQGLLPLFGATKSVHAHLMTLVLRIARVTILETFCNYARIAIWAQISGFVTLSRAAGYSIAPYVSLSIHYIRYKFMGYISGRNSSHVVLVLRAIQSK